MESWSITASIGEVLLDFSILSILLVIGSLMRRYVGLFRRYLIPTSLIAGFLGLIVGPELLSFVPMSLERMGAYVYHLLALTFIGVGLQSTRRKRGYSVINLGFMQITVMLTQAIIGLGVGLAVALLLIPGFIPATGMLLPLGFAMGPGIAFSIGNSWQAYGFPEAASVGLTIAAIGFLFAYFSGVWIINRTLSKQPERIQPPPDSEPRELGRTRPRSGVDIQIGNKLTSVLDAIEPLTIHIALVGLVYAATYFFVSGLAELLRMVGMSQEIPVIWSFHFIFANLLAMAFRRVLDRLGAGRYLDDGMIHRATGATADYLIAASIAAISLQIAWTYAGPVVVMCLLGAASTYAITNWTSNRIFQMYRFERFIGMYAQMTGTISSGLALIRVTDPEYRSPVAEDLVLSSGVALAFGFPLLVMINMPFTVFGGSISGYAIVMGIQVVYLTIICLFWYRFVKQGNNSETAGN